MRNTARCATGHDRPGSAVTIARVRNCKPNNLDEERKLLWFAPRKPGAGKSRLNNERIVKMLKAGKIVLLTLTDDAIEGQLALQEKRKPVCKVA